MSVQENKEHTDAVRKMAEFQISAAVEAVERRDEHASAFRWMIASLFALNGGAILSIFGSKNLGVQAGFEGLWVFFAGIVTTFLAVIFSQVSDRWMIDRMHTWGLYWVTVGELGKRDETREASLKAEIAEAEKIGRWGRLQGIFAMVFFIMGIITTVVLEQKEAIAELEAKFEHLEKTEAQ